MAEDTTVYMGIIKERIYAATNSGFESLNDGMEMFDAEESILAFLQGMFSTFSRRFPTRTLSIPRIVRYCGSAPVAGLV